MTEGLDQIKAAGVEAGTSYFVEQAISQMNAEQRAAKDE